MPAYTLQNWRLAENDLHIAEDKDAVDAVWAEIQTVGYSSIALEHLNREYNKKQIEIGVSLFLSNAIGLFIQTPQNQSETNLVFAAVSLLSSDLFDFDPNGDVEIALDGKTDPNFELDGSSDIQPKS